MNSFAIMLLILVGQYAMCSETGVHTTPYASNIQEATLYLRQNPRLKIMLKDKHGAVPKLFYASPILYLEIFNEEGDRVWPNEVTAKVDPQTTMVDLTEDGNAVVQIPPDDATQIIHVLNTLRNNKEKNLFRAQIRFDNRIEGRVGQDVLVSIVQWGDP